MSTKYNFREYNPQQMYLLSPSLNDWLEENHLARFIDECVDGMNLGKFYDAYNADGEGNAAYHPIMMVKLLLYSYCIGVTSSRKIATACEDQVSFRFLSANQFPDFRSLARFRRLHDEALKSLFVEILNLCKTAGMVKMGTVALDGTKIKANAALEANETVESLEKKIALLLKTAEETDSTEDAKYGADKRGDELPEGLQSKAERVIRLQAAKEKLEALKAEKETAHQERLQQRSAEEAATGKKKPGRKPKEKLESKEPKINLTDEDSRIMKTRQGYLQGYNAQIAVDSETQVIVAQDLTQDCNDKNQLEPMLKCMQAQCGQLPDNLAVDAGYWSEANAKLETSQTKLFIAVQKEWKQKKAQLEEPVPVGRIPANATQADLMERRLLTKEGRATYRLRGQTVEPVFGQMKSCRGFVTLRLRGKQGAALEWSLWSSTHNLLKLWRWPGLNESRN